MSPSLPSRRVSASGIVSTWAVGRAAGEFDKDGKQKPIKYVGENKYILFARLFESAYAHNVLEYDFQSEREFCKEFCNKKVATGSNKCGG